MSLSKLSFMMVRIITAVLGLKPTLSNIGKSRLVNFAVPAVTDVPDVSFEFISEEIEIDTTSIVDRYGYRDIKNINMQPSGPIFVLASSEQRHSSLFNNSNRMWTTCVPDVMRIFNEYGKFEFEVYNSKKIRPMGGKHYLLAHYVQDCTEPNIVEHIHKLASARDDLLSLLEEEIIACLFVSRGTLGDSYGPHLYPPLLTPMLSTVKEKAEETGVIICLGEYFGRIVNEMEPYKQTRMAERDAAEAWASFKKFKETVAEERAAQTELIETLRTELDELKKKKSIFRKILRKIKLGM